MNRHTTSLVLVIIIVNSHGVIPNASANETLLSNKKLLEAHVELCKKQSATNIVNADLIHLKMKLLRKCCDSLSALQSGEKSFIKNELANNRKNIAEYATGIKGRKSKYLQLKQKYDAVKVGEHQAQLVEMGKKRIALEAKIKKIKKDLSAKWYNPKNKKHRGQVEKDFMRHMKKFLKTRSKGEKSLIVNEIRGKSESEEAHFDCWWLQSANTNRFSYTFKACIKLTESSDMFKSENKIAQRYPITYSGPDEISCNVGRYLIEFTINPRATAKNNNRNKLNQAFSDPKKRKEIIQSLIDLPGLEKSGNDTIVQQFIDVKNAKQKLYKERASILIPLYSNKKNLSDKILGFSKMGYMPPVDKANLLKQVNSAKEYYNEANSYISTSKFLIDCLECPIDSRTKAISNLEKKINAMRSNIRSLCVKARKQNDEYIKDINFNEANERFKKLIKTFIRVPKSNKLAVINCYSNDARFNNMKIKCKWYFDTSTYKSYHRKCYFVCEIYFQRDNKNYSHMIKGKKYIILSKENSSVRFGVGGMSILLKSIDTEMFPGKMLPEIIEELFDIDAIANAFEK